ncbi:MAG: glutamate decarboxylase [Deltaproteobacteria bacterium]|nr:glutamate decarboxylase [Deltaproteobacteria bacterium]
MKRRRELAIDISDHVLAPSRKSNKKIIASIQYLSKLFIMPETPDKFLEFGDALLVMIREFFQEQGGIHSSISLPDLSRLFSDIDPPTDPELIVDVLYDIKEKIIRHSVKVGNPFYIGHMTSAVPYFMILIEMIIAALNQNQVKIETAKASTFVEREFLAWMHQLVFRRGKAFYKRTIQNPEIALGNVAVDGTLANLTALWVAREKAFPPRRSFAGVRRDGMAAALKHYSCSGAAVLVSKLAHYSLDKSMDVLGLGSRSLIRIPVNAENQVDCVKLRRKIAELQKKKVKIMAVVGIAGTTETGNIDDLKQLRDIASECSAHYHVDAAWGGATLLTHRYRHLLDGIDRADSVTIDTHKLFYTPMSMGLVLFRNERDLMRVKYTASYVIRKSSVDQGRFTLEGSRKFDVLKPWASLKVFGTDGFQILFDHAFTLTADLNQLISASPNFEVMNNPQLFIHVFRFVPRDVQEGLERLRALIGKNGHSAAARKKQKELNVLLNTLNTELHRAIRAEDSTFVSRTTLTTTRYAPQPIVVLRSVTVNPLTTRSILEEILAKQEKMGLSLYTRQYKKQFEKLLT